jgi:hypothetical protein
VFGIILNTAFLFCLIRPRPDELRWFLGETGVGRSAEAVCGPPTTRMPRSVLAHRRGEEEDRGHDHSPGTV